MFTLTDMSSGFEQRVYSSARWQELRARVLQRDGFSCWVCGGRATVADHRVPMSVDASRAFDESNLRGCCVSCNCARSNRPYIATRYEPRREW